MLQIIQLEPSIIGNVWYQDTWSLTADAVFVSWPTDGVGIIDCYGHVYEIKNYQNLEDACDLISLYSDFGGI